MSLTSVVCKFQCHHKEDHEINDPELPHMAQIKLGAVWEGSTESQRASENAIFGHWTPSAFLDMHIRNPDAAKFFKPGKKYYLTFTEAPE